MRKNALLGWAGLERGGGDGGGEDGDERAAGAGGRSQLMADGADESEAEAFGEGAESQEAPGSASRILINGPQHSRARARIAPSSRCMRIAVDQ